jgi:hypothetical protein
MNNITLTASNLKLNGNEFLPFSCGMYIKEIILRLLIPQKREIASGCSFISNMLRP